MNRSPHSVYFSDELRQRVSDWADKSHSSQADIYDEALEQFFDTHDISRDGTIVQTSEHDGRGVESIEKRLGEVLENQEEMMETPTGGDTSGESDGTHTESDSADEGIDEELPEVADYDRGAEQKLVDITGEYDHDVAIEADVAADVVKHSPKLRKTRADRLPAAIAALNHLIKEEGESRVLEPVSWEQMRRIIRQVCDVSASSVRNYRDELLDQGVIRPSPVDCIDKDMMEGVRMNAYASYKGVDCREVAWSTKSDNRRSKWGLSAEEIIAEVTGTDFHAESGYYIDDKQWVKNATEMFAEMARNLEHRSWSDTTAQRSGGLSPEQKAWLGRHLLIKYCPILERYTDRVASNAVNVASLTMQDNDDWGNQWRQYQEAVASELGSGDGESDTGMDESKARELLGVDEEEGEDAVRHAYEEWMTENHPDQSEEEMDYDKYQDMIAAREVLVG